MRVREARLDQLRAQMDARRRPGAAASANPVDEWRLISRGFGTERTAEQETLYSVANGYLGMRGTHEEGTPVHDPGVLLNGFHETWAIPYGESAFGFATTGQTIVSAPDGSVIRLYVDEEPFTLADALIRGYERTLDMRSGIVERAVEFETPRGAVVSLRSRRLASLEWRHLVAMTYEVTLVSGHAKLAVSSELVATAPPGEPSDDPRAVSRFDESVLEPVDGTADGTRVVLEQRTRASRIGLACGMDHVVETQLRHSVEASVEADAGRIVILLDAEPGIPARITKYLAYHHAADAPKGDLQRRCHRTLDRARSDGFVEIELVQRERLDAFWESSDVIVEGAPDIQQAVRFCLFQLRQATARVEGHGVPAKGVTGRGYEGQYFWDAEIYVLPFLTYTQPHVARRLLRFRYEMLPAARRRAGELGHRGGLFPWRTINGEEASAYYAAGTAQYHINADIAYAVRQFSRITGDRAFLTGEGAEMLVETARFWFDLGFFSERSDGQFCINGVTGPDEYSAIVDNNAYTNLMARENLRTAIRAVELLRDRDEDAYVRLEETLGFDEGELDSWRRAAEGMRVPYDERAGVFLQDERFLDREAWDFDATPISDYPLLLHHHPLNIYRHQVIKQTDVVLAVFLLDEDFSAQEKRRVFDYYDPLTTADSTLSACVQSVVASEVGYAQQAYEYFLLAAGVDLGDLAGNVKDGIHIASCGGVWMALVNGFAGLRHGEDELRFTPRLPAEWTRLRFRLTVEGQRLEVDMTTAETTYRLLEGSGLSLDTESGRHMLTHDAPLRVAAGARGEETTAASVASS